MKKLLVILITGLLMLCFSGMAQATPYAGDTMTLTATASDPLKIGISSTDPYPLISQVGTMTGNFDGLDWTMTYTAALNWELTNEAGWTASGYYTSTGAADLDWDAGMDSGKTYNGHSTTTATLFDVSDVAILTVVGTGFWAGNWGAPPVEWWGDGVFTFTENAPGPVPEPATMLLFGTGLIGLAGFGRKKFMK